MACYLCPVLKILLSHKYLTFIFCFHIIDVMMICINHFNIDTKEIYRYCVYSISFFNLLSIYGVIFKNVLYEWLNSPISHCYFKFITVLYSYAGYIRKCIKYFLANKTFDYFKFSEYSYNIDLLMGVIF